MEQTNRRYAGVAGVVAAGAALGLGELLAGAFESVASPLGSVGGLVVDNVPLGVERWAISVFGTADKVALAIGTVVIVLTIAWFVAVAALERFWTAIVVFVSFIAVGAAAGFGEPGAAVVPVIAAASVAAGSGLVILRLMLQAIEGAASPDPEEHIAADATGAGSWHWRVSGERPPSGPGWSGGLYSLRCRRPRRLRSPVWGL